MLIRKNLVVAIKCSPIEKKMRKSFKTEIKPKFIPNASKREAMAPKIPLKGCSLKIEILIRHLLFYLKLTIWLSCLKKLLNVSWEGAYL